MFEVVGLSIWCDPLTDKQKRKRGRSSFLQQKSNFFGGNAFRCSWRVRK
jgi:hypothetical protein